MMETLQSSLASDAPWIAVGIATICAILIFFRVTKEKMHRRARDLEIAKNALHAHYQAVNVVLADPAPSKQLKASLCAFSEAVTEREFGLMIGQAIRDGTLAKRKVSSDAKIIHKERGELSKKYEHLDRAFRTATEAGIVALFLRWPEITDLYSEVQLTVAEDERKESQIAQKAISFIKNRTNDSNGSNHGEGPSGPMALPA
ncbi:MAG: hypothetical protein H6887_11930 [Hoeflea sp.]|nr:hypothetical protein [Hoeflea sp.]